jgi:glycosyltransferase involved in cell wall biosynthesis
MNIWIINHYGGPPNSGRFERPVYTARAFASRGHACTVFSAGFHHLLNAPEQLAEPRIKVHDGSTYVELPSRSYGSNGLARVLNMLDSSRALWRLAKNLPQSVPVPDLVIVSSPPPFLFDAARKLRRRFGCKLIFEVRDLWPESLVQLAGASEWHPFVLWLRYSARRAYREADSIVSLLPAIDRYFDEIGVPQKKVTVITNGIDPEIFEARNNFPLPDIHVSTLRRLRERGKMIVIYTGAMGPPNALDQLLELPTRSDGTEPPYHLLLVGDGVSRSHLESEVRRRGLGFVTFLPKVEKRQIPALLRMAHAAITICNDVPLYRFGVSPNKVSEYLLAEKPVVWVGITGNDPIADSGAGISVPANDPFVLEKALTDLATMGRGELAELGRRGKKHALENFNWEKLGTQYETLARDLIGDRSHE